ncbi:hypothetical protein M422DRAFT_257429 [Sphaerobolus stellatus SS14]|uniref:Uncharacterized protein n=1 Tax=Sphaerobolus stellatus (strain SS14) TaxID=990650 RepID=A0A0C9VEK8_SPHS4|nr:hypothetical protein M422DRAFT_257429 [Sphaerobolus stellatus SS14]
MNSQDKVHTRHDTQEYLLETLSSSNLSANASSSIDKTYSNWLPSLAPGDVEQGLRRPDADMDAGRRMSGITLVEARGIMSSNITTSQPMESQDKAHPRHDTQEYPLEAVSSSNFLHTTHTCPAALNSIHTEPQREAYYPGPVKLAPGSTMMYLHKVLANDSMFPDGTVPIPPEELQPPVLDAKGKQRRGRKERPWVTFSNSSSDV